MRGPLVFSRERLKPRGESDLLVYTRGNLFCVEIKNYRGTIYYPGQSLPPGGWLMRLLTRQKVSTGYNDSEIIQQKRGNYGEILPPRRYPNPLKKTKAFIYGLKEQTARLEPRFGRLRIIPVLAFVHNKDTDIRAIRSMEQGIIYVEELPQFFASHEDAKFAARPSQWVINTLQNNIPSWDWAVTTSGQWLGGILVEQQLRFEEPGGRVRQLSCYTIRSVLWKRGIFSEYDKMLVSFIDGTEQTFQCVRGEISLQRYDEFYRVQLKDVQQLIMGSFKGWK